MALTNPGSVWTPLTPIPISAAWGRSPSTISQCGLGQRLSPCAGKVFLL